jgi:hypothetical protein
VINLFSDRAGIVRHDNICLTASYYKHPAMINDFFIIPFYRYT